VAEDEPAGGICIARLGHDLEVLFVLQQQPQPSPHELLLLGENNPYLLRGALATHCATFRRRGVDRLEVSRT
jgi:hypothetical protein